MVTDQLRQVQRLSPHPYVQSTDDSWMRLVRAHYWLVADSDFRHAAYWRDQVTLAEAAFVADRQARVSNAPDHVRAQQPVVLSDMIRRAVVEGYGYAARRPYRGGVDVPFQHFTMWDGDGGFESGSVCNTRTLSNGLDSPLLEGGRR